MAQSPSNSDLENIYETLNTVGWDLLIEGWQRDFDSCNQVVACETERDLLLRKGMLSVYQQLLMLKDVIKAEMDQDADL